MSRAKLPNGLTEQQERFAQAVAGGMNQSDAYRNSYSCASWAANRVWEQASKIASNPKVRSRIAELQAEISAKTVEKVAVGKLDIIADLLDNARIMREPQPVYGENGLPLIDSDGHPVTVRPSPAHITAATRNLELVGKELGMFVDRKEIRTGSLDGKGETELQEHIAELEREIKRLEGQNAATRH